MRRGLFAAIALAAASFASCGDDGDDDRTVAFVRTTPIAQESQDAFLDELEAAGWVVGDNLILLNDDPTAGFEDEAAASEAVDGFVEDGADLVVALSTTSAMAALQATDEVPIVTLANDPVASGIVAEPREPEANITGVSFRVPADRTIDVARQLVGGDPVVGLLHPGDDAGAEPIVDAMLAAASSLDVELLEESFVGGDEVAVAVDRLVDRGAEVLVIANATGTARVLPEIEAATRSANIAVVANIASNPFAVAVLAPDSVALYRQLGRQAARLLDGTDVADVPVEDPGSFQLHLRAAAVEELGLDLGDDLLEQADVVDE